MLSLGVLAVLAGSFSLPVAAQAATTTPKLPTQKAVSKNVVKAVAKPAPAKTQTWTGVITGIESNEIFYLKLNLKKNTGELRVKVTPATKFVRIPSATSISDFQGGDYIEVTGVKLDSHTVKAASIKFISDQFKES